MEECVTDSQMVFLSKTLPNQHVLSLPLLSLYLFFYDYLFIMPAIQLSTAVLTSE